MVAGRPPLFETPEELEEKINDYIKNCPDRKKVYVKNRDGETETVDVPAYTITGLAYYLGFESRQSFYDYEEKEEFTYIIKRARTFIEKEYETLLQSGTCTGVIFALKNMGWSDNIKTENINTERKIYIEREEKEDMIKHIEETINE